MIEKNSKNIQLSLEQLQQLDVYQTRMTNLDNEIFSASKHLQEIRQDTDRLTREKEYQQELLNTLTKQTTDLEEKKQVLEIAVSTAEQSVEEYTKKVDDLRLEQSEQSSKIAEEMTILDTRKKQYHKEWSDIVVEKEGIENSRKEVEAARQIIDNAVKSIPWK